MNDNDNSVQGLHNMVFKLDQTVTDRINSICKSLPNQIYECVEATFAQATELKIQNHIKALEDYKQDKPLTMEQLSSLYTRLKLGFEEVRLSNDNYALYDQMNRVIQDLDGMKNKLTKIESKQNEIDSGQKYIDCEITAEELKKLYDESGLSPDKISKDFNISKPTFYNVLNCKDDNLKRRQDLKNYLITSIKNKEEK